MANKKVTKSVSDDKTYPVKAIVGCEYSPSEDIFRYKVAWDGNSEKSYSEPTLEPLDCLTQCHLLLVAYERVLLDDLKMTCSDIKELGGQRKPAIEEFVQHLKGKDKMPQVIQKCEHIPTGKEIIRR